MSDPILAQLMAELDDLRARIAYLETIDKYKVDDAGLITFEAGLSMASTIITDLGDPVNSTDAVNLHYLQDHMNLTKHYYFRSSAIASTTLLESENYDAETLNATPTDTLSNLYFKSAVLDTPTPFTIGSGSLVVFHFNAKASATAGVKAVTVQMRLYYVDADGTSNKTAICDISDTSATLTTTKTYYELHSHIATTVVVPAGKRLWVEIYANTSGAAVGYPDLWIYRDSASDHVSFGVLGTILSNFVQKSGDTMTGILTALGFTSEKVVANNVANGGTFDTTTVMPNAVSDQSTYLYSIQVYSANDTVDAEGLYMISENGTGNIVTAISAITNITVTVVSYKVRVTNNIGAGRYFRCSLVRLY